MNVFTHDRIDLANGLLANTSLLWGQNALQTVNITRNTPRPQNQAVGYLGVVDYSRGVVTSDVTLDTILVEGCTACVNDPTQTAISSINRYAGMSVSMTSELYALTSFAMALASGSPITANYGWITAGLASYLSTKPQPTLSDGTQFAVVVGDYHNGITLVATWSGTVATSTIPVLDANGNLTSIDDSGLPAGVQSMNISGNINRDQVLDVRSTRPQCFVTTYPVRITCDMQVYQLPGTTDPNTTAPAWGELQSVTIQSRDQINNANKVYATVGGLVKQTEGESINVGRFLAYTVNFEGREIYFPIPAA